MSDDMRIVPEVLDYRVEIPLGSMSENEQTKFWLVEGRLREKGVKFDTGFSFSMTFSGDEMEKRSNSGMVREWNLDWSLKGMTANTILEHLRYHNIEFEVEITVRD